MMAAKKKKGGFVGKLLKILLGLILLAVLVIGGFAAGIYLQLIDAEEANAKFELYKLPVVGEYFVKPPGADDTGEISIEKSVSVETKTEVAVNVPPTQPAAPPTPPKAPEPEKKESKPVVVSKEDIEKERQAQAAAEKKRVTKLARLYEQMKPQEAAQAMDSLSDDITVAILKRMEESQAAKIMAAFEADKAASITQIMYEGP